MRRLGLWMGLATLGLTLLLPAPAGARTVEVHLVVKSDLQRLHPNAPPDEPLEPTPTLAEKAREVISAHPAFSQVTLRLEKSDSAPNPRVPGDFVRLVDRGVDDVVEVNLNYHLRLDSFHASGKAGVQGYVAVYSVPGRRKVLSRTFTLVVSYPGEVTKAAVIQAELTARSSGTAVPIEELELRLLDAAVKERLGSELGNALGAYYSGSLPLLSKEAVRESLARMALFLAHAPDRRDDAILALENYLQRYPDAPNRAQFEQQLARLKQAAGRGPGPKAKPQSDWAAMGISQAVTAKELAEAFERLVGSKIELWSFKLDWRDGTVVLTPTDKNQDFIVEGTPPTLRELETDPNPIYILVVGRREDPRMPLVDVKVPVVRFIGCPKTSCP